MGKFERKVKKSLQAERQPFADWFAENAAQFGGFSAADGADVAVGAGGLAARRRKRTLWLTAAAFLLGALCTLIPEVPYDLDRDVISRMKLTQRTGKRHFIILIAEGVGHAGDLANEIQSRTGIDSRATVLGHVQRGGSPTLRDRVTASRMGYHAIELLARGIYNRVVATRAESIVDYDISVALSMYKTIDTSLLDIATAISI